MNEESLRKRIRGLLEEIQTGADPVLLTRCRSIFRQEVSFFHRSYMAAYLLLMAEGAAAPQSGGGQQERKIRRDRGESRNRTGKPQRQESAEPVHYLGDEESARLFISVGRNRKVFPREILALINAKTQIPRDDIGNIRILDNYSFIQVRTGAAEMVIRALNGHSFRGRTLTVNYARNRRDEEEPGAGGVPEIPAKEESGLPPAPDFPGTEN
ncbi:MAG: DbpA RNA binding domain-containing protein [Treponema sp.]|jgi:hypothetical protein|nr:DbpA RNA binding domain-containing protein [Treponema sp.]